MFPEERRRAIIDIVMQDGTVMVNDLSKRFEVTKDCIRKDLTDIEKQGYLVRTHGGAVATRKNTHNFQVSARKVTNVDAKRKIAQKAVKLISEGDTVFLDISTSNLEIMKEIVREGLNVTIVTNMVEIISLAGLSGIPLMSSGGKLNKTGDGFTGALTAAFISEFRFDIGFFGVVGIDINNNGVYTYDAEDGNIKKVAIEASKRALLVAEKEKFNRDGNYKYSTLNSFEGIILESKPELEIITKAKKIGIKLL